MRYSVESIARSTRVMREVLRCWDHTYQEMSLYILETFLWSLFSGFSILLNLVNTDKNKSLSLGSCVHPHHFSLYSWSFFWMFCLNYSCRSLLHLYLQMSLFLCISYNITFKCLKLEGETLCTNRTALTLYCRITHEETLNN